jgi:hypothetical protein
MHVLPVRKVGGNVENIPRSRSHKSSRFRRELVENIPRSRSHKSSRFVAARKRRLTEQ